MAGALIGRTEERRRVAAALAEVVATQQPRCVELVGDAGVGKTTLLRQWCLDAVDGGARVLLGGISEPESELSWAGLATVLGRIADEAPALAGSIPDPLRAALGLVEEGGTDPGSVAFALSRLLQDLASERPVVVAVDDVQWLDRPSVAAVTFALRVRAPVLFLLARRGGGPPPIDAVRAIGTAQVQVIELSGLSVGGVHGIVERVAGRHPGRRDLVRLHQLTRGNPLFVERIAALLANGRQLDDVEVPRDLEQALGAQLDDVAAETLRCLAAVALAGRPSVDLLSEMFGQALGAALADAEARQLVVERGGLVEIAHPLLREVVVRRLGALDRRRLHGLLAEHLTDPEQRAWHTAAASTGPDATVAEALADAADSAAARGAPERAVDLLRSAIVATPDDRPDQRWARLRFAGLYAVQAGMWHEAIDLLTEALRTAPSRAEARTVARPLSVATHRISPPSVTLALAESLIAELGDDPAFLAGMFRVAAHVSMYDDLRRALSSAEQAVEVARGADDPVQEILSQCLLVQAQYLAGEATDLDGFLAEITRVSDPDDREFLEDATVDLLRHENRFEPAIAHSMVMLDRARRSGDVTLLVNALSSLSTAEIKSGQIRSAGVHVAELYEVCVLLDSDIDLADALGQLCYARALLGEDIEDLLAAVELLRRDATPMMAFQLDAQVGIALLVRNDVVGAERLLDRAASVAATWGHDDLRTLPIAHELVEARVRLGQLDRADSVARWAVATADRQGGDLPHAVAERCLGMLTAARGDRERAVEHLRRAVDHHVRADTPLERARTQLDLGIALRGLRRRRDARGELESALTTFVELGTLPFEGRTRDELRRLGSSTAETTVDRLTETEQQVAEAVATGATNAEIAASLHISLRTVESNLTRVYRKLGIRSRTELTARLRERHR